ncbi:phosphate/phosphite/phosphonate ABC transporter substrate-binding protein [Psychromicrobium xiongbiense]|uniref:phosphate/phosphite/phosphonate ABC transporter substrate-binding protein n=1 Tax=Psychromicrobium xiongbiense TaxID=3051184 RepID=UPI002554B4ED|nr:phosphate/phosphite/phosphonate ABC transporter substrate-binding protein [Psychromicrobium sp. YIM S02556]
MKKTGKAALHLAALGVTAVLALTACGGGAASSSSSEAGTFAQDSSTLIMGMVPDEGQATSTYDPLKQYVEKVTGKKVEVKQSTSYAALIEAAVGGQVDVVSFSGFTYLQAKAKGATFTPVGATITETGTGKPGYYSAAIVPAASGIKDVAGFAGKKVCFVNENSTSGYLFPQYMLKKAGVDTKTGITSVMAGTHDVSAQKVAKGTECDAGFAQEITVTTTGPAAGLFKANDLKIVDKVLVPGPPFAISDKLPGDLKKTLTDKLSKVTVKDIKDAGITTNPAFEKFFGDGNAPVDDAYYNDLRDFCKKLPDVKTCAGI